MGKAGGNAKGSMQRKKLEHCDLVLLPSRTGDDGWGEGLRLPAYLTHPWSPASTSYSNKHLEPTCPKPQLVYISKTLGRKKKDRGLNRYF